MKKSITLSLALTLLTAPAFGFKQEDLDKLKATNGCEKCSLSEADLRGANLEEANLYGAYLTKASLTKANLYGAYLVGAKLREANLRGADLSGAVLRDAELDYAVLNNAILCNTFMPDGQRTFRIAHAILAKTYSNG